jgi:hypothetical protein
MRALDCCDIGFRHIGRGEAGGRVHAQFHHRLFHPRRANSVDAELSRHLERGGTNETLEASVDHRDRCASHHWVHREYARSHGDRAALAKVILRYPSKRYLPHELAAKAELIVGIGQIGERPEGTATATTTAATITPAAWCSITRPNSRCSVARDGVPSFV